MPREQEQVPADLHSIDRRARTNPTLSHVDKTDKGRHTLAELIEVMQKAGQPHVQGSATSQEMGENQHLPKTSALNALREGVSQPQNLGSAAVSSDKGRVSPAYHIPQ